MKLSTEKLIYPGRKQIFRHVKDGRMAGDTLGHWNESLPGERLLRPVMQGGECLGEGREPLEAIRERARQELGRLPNELRGLQTAPRPYRVQRSDALEQTLETTPEAMKRFQVVSAASGGR